MNRTALARLLDHSLLRPDTTEMDILVQAEVVRQWGIGFFCVQPSYVSLAAGPLRSTGARVVSVLGFPHGCDRSSVKAFAAELAVRDGASKVDMVMNIGRLKSGRTQAVADEIAQVVRAIPGIPVKVILETCFLTDEEKVMACRLVQDSGAAFVKTSTGVKPAGGATVEDIRLLRATVGPDFGVKASGGIRTLADALALIQAGANRLGTSASAAQMAEPHLAAYASAKGAVISLARVMALELAVHHITVNVVLPSTTLTDMASTSRYSGEALQRVLSRYPLGRLGRPTDTAAAIAFLASEAAGWITGQSLVVDGGCMINNDKHNVLQFGRRPLSAAV